MRYYIADLHYCHEKLNNAMDQRGFASVADMNEYMIKQWNQRVKPGDEVVILGDFCMSHNAAEVNEILERLKGRKYLIIGNHDHYLDSRKFDRKHFQWVEHYKELYDNKRKVILSHYPIMCYNGQYRLDSEGNPRVYMLYGHVHNTFDEFLVNKYQEDIKAYKRPIRGVEGLANIPCKMINCFCMFSDYVPLTLDEWIRVDEERRKKMPLTVKGEMAVEWFASMTGRE